MTAPPGRRPPRRVRRAFVIVSHTGTVHPSGFLQPDAGNVRDRVAHRKEPAVHA
ncbi:hypothetical protein ABT158_33305 [Nonomuraea sp. NPDC001636]|uniref:hypothetical protein n=1 Tax=Nonomuraea sp. NPDC001636 TaxID=3154391 RepID=UPI0033272F51